MCTSVFLKSGFFGRTLDYETSFGEPISTRYASAMDMESLTYYYKTYDGLNLKSQAINPECMEAKSYPLYEKS